MQDKVEQHVMKATVIGVGTKGSNLREIEDILDKNAREGWRLHTFSTANDGTKDRVLATMVSSHGLVGCPMGAWAHRAAPMTRYVHSRYFR